MPKYGSMLLVIVKVGENVERYSWPTTSPDELSARCHIASRLIEHLGRKHGLESVSVCYSMFITVDSGQPTIEDVPLDQFSGTR